MKTFFLENTCGCVLGPWSLASSIPVLGLERFCPRKGCPWPWPRIFLCPWPWPRAFCPRLHLWFQLSFVCGYFHASFPHRHWMKQELRHTSPFLKAVVGRGLLTSSRAPTIQSRRGQQLWSVKRERAPIAVNRLGCTTYELLRSVDL